MGFLEDKTAIITGRNKQKLTDAKEELERLYNIDVLINNAQASASGITLADHTTEQFDLASTLHLVPDYLETSDSVLMLLQKKESVV